MSEMLEVHDSKVATAAIIGGSKKNPTEFLKQVQHSFLFILKHFRT